MPSKSINQTILKKRHSGDNNPITHTHQLLQDKTFVKQGQKARGIDIGNLTDFNANTQYNEAKRMVAEPIKDLRHPDTELEQLKAPSHLHEKNPHHLFRCDCDRPDAKEIVQN